MTTSAITASAERAEDLLKALPFVSNGDADRVGMTRSRIVPVRLEAPPQCRISARTMTRF
jgi:hypothetical protein